MNRFLFAAALLVCISPLARAHTPLLLNAVVLPCEANSRNLELIEATPEPTPCTELSTPAAAPPLEIVPAPAVSEKPGGGDVVRARNMLPTEKASPFRLTQFENPPVIDGKLDDEVWKSAAQFEDFYQCRATDSPAASSRTEVRAGYDSRFIYLAFYANDDPTRIRASVARRDSIFDDETVGLLLETFNVKRRAYELFFNPLGVQADGFLIEGGNDDFNVEIVMESKGSVTADGYVVEVAIPFKSLRCEAGNDKLCGVHKARTQFAVLKLSRKPNALVGSVTQQKLSLII